MKRLTQLPKSHDPVNHARNRLSRAGWSGTLVLIASALAWLALSSPVRGVCEEGCDLTHGNTFLGDAALANNTSGRLNTAVGDSALAFNSAGNYNTATGVDALLLNTTGNYNTAVGFETLYSNTTGNYSAASGGYALFSNTTGSYDTASGYQALYSNTTGNYNAASGGYALYSNTTGSYNTASGYGALLSNTTGTNNTANGGYALYSNTTGVSNMATGYQALYHNTTGFYNMANGSGALVKNKTGSYNVAEGLNALRLNTTGNSNTAVGLSALLNNTTGGANIALGGSAGAALTTGSNNIAIGNVGVAGESGRIRIGTSGKQTSTYVAGISGLVVAGGVGVIVNTDGQLGTVVSSARYKEAIEPMDKASESILALKPVTFRYKKELDLECIPQFGLVAEEVEKVNPDLVARDEKGQPYTVRYEAVNAMLLNEFLKEHRKVKELQTNVAELKLTDALQKDLGVKVAQLERQIENLTTVLKEQSKQIQKVSEQLGATKSAPQLVNND